MNLSSVIAYLKRLTGRPSFCMDEHFQKIYEKNLFGGAESMSGTGSSLEQTEKIRRELPRLLDRLGIKNILDAPCGDCNWIAELDWTGINYTGIDIVSKLIEANRTRLAGRPLTFMTADLCEDTLPRTDLILCRDCWVHLDYMRIRSCLVNFRKSGTRYLLTTTFTRRPKNRDLGGIIWRPLNLQAAPFYFPEPLELLVEGCTEEHERYADKSLALWNLQDLKF